MRRKSKLSSWMNMIVAAGIIGGGIYLYNAPIIERVAPTVSIESNGFWNLKKPLKILLDDESGLRSYRVVMHTAEETVELSSEQFMTPEKAVTLEVAAPKRLMRLKEDAVRISIEATDASKWNFLNGNSTVVEKSFTIDTKRPLLSLISNSYGIRRGGSALVIFRAEDSNMEHFYLETNFGKRFQAQPFMKPGYYAALVAWPVTEEHFSATLVGEDMAGNSSRASVPFYLKSGKYRDRTLKLSEKYLDGKIAQLAEDYPETEGVTDRISQFKIINEDVRRANENLIHDVTSKVPDTQVDSFKIAPFYPLKNGQNLGGFGDHRSYTYNNNKVSEAYHLGVDLASVKQAPITTQNAGDVVFVGYNGIYGNMPIIHHGMGLYTLYAHCSTVFVQEGQRVNAGTVVGKTGTTGSVLGDHLHFGVLVQGIDVRPQEWMDAQWMRLNITEVMQSAQKYISRQ